MAKEEIVLDLSVDQGSMISELERTKKSIIELKKEQQDLTKAYKAGNVTIEEYAAESVRLEAILKKEQSTYNNTQKAVTGVKTKMDELIVSNNKLSQSVKQSTENIRVGGISVADLGAKIGALANPVTAAVSIVGALGAAYARSSIGAKDLEFASTQLGFATTILTDKFAGLFSSVEDGEGVVSQFVNRAIAQFAGLDTAITSKLAANAREELEQIQRDRIKANADINDKLSENSELLTDIANKETSITDKLSKSQTIQDNLTDIANARLELLNREETQERILGATTANKEGLEKRLNEIEAERARVTKEETKQKEKIEKQVNAIVNAENKDLEIQKQKTAELKKQEDIRQSEINRNKRIRDLEESLAPEKGIGGENVDDNITGVTANIEIKQNKLLNSFIDREEKKRAEIKKTTKATKDAKEEELQIVEEGFLQLADLFSQGSDARRIFALGAIGTDTAEAISAATAAAEKNPFNAATFSGAGIAQFAASLIRIFANIGAAKQFLGGSFAGGADFVTSKPTMIMVGDNPGNRERVTVQPLSGRGKSSYNKNAGLASFAGGGSMTFDPASAAATQNINQALATSNAIKRMPRPVVGVKEIARVMQAVEVKQNVSKQ